MGSLLIYTSPAYFRCTGKEKENVRKGLPFPGPPSRKPAARRQEKQLYFGKGGRQPGPGRRPGARGRKRPRERRTPPPQPHTPAGRRAAEGPPQGAEGGAGCPRPSPARGGNVSGLKDAAAAPRPPPRPRSHKGPSPLPPLSSFPNSSTGLRGLSPPAPPSRPALATPAHPCPQVRKIGIRCGQRPRKHWAPRARRRGRGPPAQARAGVSPPPPPRKPGAAASSSFRLSLAPSLGRPVLRESSVLCGRRRTLLRARPPPDSSPGSRRAARRPARRSCPAPAARARPLRGPLPRPGNARPADREPAFARFQFPPLAPAQRHMRQFCSFPGSGGSPSPFSRPYPSFPRPFPLLDPTGKPKQLGPRKREKGSGKGRKGGGGAR